MGEVLLCVQVWNLCIAANNDGVELGAEILRFSQEISSQNALSSFSPKCFDARTTSSELEPVTYKLIPWHAVLILPSMLTILETSI